MKYRISAFCLFVLFPLFLFSQGPFSYDIELQYVNYNNGSTMRLDDDSGNYANINEYELTGSGDYTTAPVAFTAGNTFYVEANFQTSCLTIESIFIRGKHIRPDGTELIFPAHEITSGGTGVLHYSFDYPTESGSAFTFPANTVEFHDPFEITWQFSLDNSSNDNDWATIHTSANPLYVTKTYANFSWQTPYHTYFRTSCEAADGLSNNDEIINAVWAVFQTLNSFKRADDNGTIAYYGDWTNADFFADDMIPSGNGQCSAYSMSFLNCLKVQGINQQNDYLFVTAELPSSSESFGLLVKKFQSNTDIPFSHWTNSAPSVPQGFSIDKVVIPNQIQNPYNFSSSNFADNVLYTEIDDLPGEPGQSSGNPKSVFANHQIISLTVGGDTVLYDVPYGVTYDSLNQMRGNIFGYLYETMAEVDETEIGYDLNGDNTLVTNALVTVWLIDTDQEALELDGEELNNF